MSIEITWLSKLGAQFQRAFLEGDRWKLYLQGLGKSLGWDRGPDWYHAQKIIRDLMRP